MAVSIARVTEVIQRPFRYVPLYVFEIVQEKWKEFLPLISRKAAIAGAKTAAFDIALAEEVDILATEQCIGFVRLWLEKRGLFETQTWCVDIWHNIHFKGHWDKPPRLIDAKHIRFSALPKHHFDSDPTKIGSYLKIKNIRWSIL